MNNKVCKQCSSNFEPTNEKRGHEQLYCSKKCGQTSARLRREERLKNAFRYEQQQQQPNEPTSKSTNMEQQQVGGIGPIGGGNSVNDLSHLEKLYEAKIENNYLKIKCDNLEEKVRLLQLDVNDLNMELDAMDIDEEIESGNNGILGGIFEQFKSDPITTIGMIKMMFNNDTNQKNEKQTATKTA
jgi:hypothetical protein